MRHRMHWIICHSLNKIVNMKYLFFLLTLLATQACAQTTTRGMNWKHSFFLGSFVYSGQIKNNKPDGIGYAFSKDIGYKIFGSFKNGLLDGKSVTIDERGTIFIQTWDKGKMHAPAVWLTERGYSLYSGNMIGPWFDGKVLTIDKDNEMCVGEMKNSEFIGRVLCVPTEGNIVLDNVYVDGHKEGPGYKL